MSTSTKRYLVLFFLGLLATFPHWARYHDMDDEATAAVLGAVRLLQGEIPYRDWTTRHTPGSYFVTAIYFVFCGTGQFGTRSLLALVSSFTGLALFKCAERVLPGAFAYLPWLLWTGGGLIEKPNLSHHWFAGLATLVTLYASLRWVESGQVRQAAWVGFWTALTSWFLQSNGLSALLMVLLIGLRFRPPGKRRLVAAFLITQVLLWLPWLPWVNQVWINHMVGLDRHMLFNRHPYSWHHLGEIFEGTLRINLGEKGIHGLAAWGYVWHIFPQYGLFYWVILPGVLLAERRRHRAGIALAYGCLAWALTVGYCQDIHYLSFSAPAFQLGLLAWLAFAWPGREAVVGLWAAGELLAWAVLAWSIQTAYQYPLTTRSGTYYTFDPQEASVFNELHAWLEVNAPAGSQVLAYPYFSRMYTLEKLANPLPQPILLPWLYAEEDFVQAAALLEQKRVPYILHRVLSLDVIHYAYPAIPMDQFQAAYLRQEARIFANYKKVWSKAGYEIWARKDAVGGNGKDHVGIIAAASD